MVNRDIKIIRQKKNIFLQNEKKKKITNLQKKQTQLGYGVISLRRITFTTQSKFPHIQITHKKKFS